MNLFNFFRTFLSAIGSRFFLIIIVLPMFFYFFAPAGPAVSQFFQRIANGENPFSELTQTNIVQAGPAKIEPTPTPVKEPPFTILLMGYGGGGHDGPLLADSMILAVLDLKARSVSLLSIPRDTLVNLPLEEDGVWSKINTVYAYGMYQSVYTDRPDRYKQPKSGGILAKDVLAEVMGVPIRNYLALDFKTFRNIIDEVGGLDINVQASFSSMYPLEDDPSIDPSWTVVSFRAGIEHMNGERAIQYARAREAIDNMAEGSDFARSRRQQQIMQVFVEKLMTPAGISHLPGLLSIVNKSIDTDLQVPGIGELQQLLTDWRGFKLTEAVLTSDNYLTSDGSSENGYYLTPVVGQNNWSQIHLLVQTLIDNPLLAQQMTATKIMVRDGSGKAARGKEVREKLMAQGFAVAPVGVVPAETTSRIEDATNGNAAVLIDAVKNAFNDPLLPVLDVKPASSTITIVVGSDW